MTRRIATLVAAIAVTLGLLSLAPALPVQASSTAYTWVKHTNTSGYNQRIMVKCHTSGDWRTLSIGDASGQVCGQNGWVDSIWAIDGGWLTALNLNTGRYTQYGTAYRGPIGGGQYYVWVSKFPVRVAAAHRVSDSAP